MQLFEAAVCGTTSRKDKAVCSLLPQAPPSNCAQGFMLHQLLLVYQVTSALSEIRYLFYCPLYSILVTVLCCDPNNPKLLLRPQTLGPNFDQYLNLIECLGF